MAHPPPRRGPRPPAPPSERPAPIRAGKGALRLLLGARWALASTAAHLVGFAALKLLPAYQGPTHGQAIEVSVQHQPEPPPLVPPTVTPPLAPPQNPLDKQSPRALERRDRDHVPPPVAAPPDDKTVTNPPPEEHPLPTAPMPPTEGTPPAGRPNLFAPSALERAVPSQVTGVVIAGRPSPWGGTTRRAGDGLAEPNTRDKYADREEAAARIREFYDQTSGQERANSGRVPPHWREAERRIGLAFNPPASLITDDNRGVSWLKQMLAAKPHSDPTPRGLDPSTEVGATQAYAQSLAGQASSSEAASWARTEIEVIIDEQGNVISSRVLRRSGRRKFDQAALEAVLKAIEGHGAPEDLGGAKGTVVTRWAVEAAVAVAAPTSVGFGFDESTGKVSGSYPMKKEVKTKVALLSVLPRR